MAIRLFVEQTATDQSRFFDGKSGEKSDALNGFVADVTTIVQSQCERATDYADIETLVSQFPIDRLCLIA
jgi:putative transposase